MFFIPCFKSSSFKGEISVSMHLTCGNEFLCSEICRMMGTECSNWPHKPFLPLAWTTYSTRTLAQHVHHSKKNLAEQ
jgi:hypothetical protein